MTKDITPYCRHQLVGDGSIDSYVFDIDCMHVIQRHLQSKDSIYPQFLAQGVRMFFDALDPDITFDAWTYETDDYYTEAFLPEGELNEVWGGVMLTFGLLRHRARLHEDFLPWLAEGYAHEAVRNFLFGWLTQHVAPRVSQPQFMGPEHVMQLEVFIDDDGYTFRPKLGKRTEENNHRLDIV